MNSAKETNKLIHFASRLPNLGLKLSEELNFYLFDKSQLRIAKQTLIDKYNTMNFISLRGKKDLILASTKTALNIVHSSSKESQEELFTDNAYKYMFCFPAHKNINSLFFKLDLHPIATASIISNIKNCTWEFILTSEI